MIHLYTGEGEGKTIAALGLAMRAIGHGKKVILVQFMKGRKNIGEYLIAKRLAPNFVVRQFGREEFIDLKNPNEEDCRWAREALFFAKEALRSRPDLLILDEVNLAVAIGLIDLGDVLSLLDDVPKDVTVVLTGRRAPKELVERADLVTEMVYVKHPFDVGVRDREGLDY